MQFKLKENTVIDSEIVVQDNKAKLDLLLGIVLVGAYATVNWLIGHNIGNTELLSWAQPATLVAIGASAGALVTRVGFTNGITDIKEI